MGPCMGIAWMVLFGSQCHHVWDPCDGQHVVLWVCTWLVTCPRQLVLGWLRLCEVRIRCACGSVRCCLSWCTASPHGAPCMCAQCCCRAYTGHTRMEFCPAFIDYHWPCTAF